MNEYSITGEKMNEYSIREKMNEYSIRREDERVQYQRRR